MVPGWRGSGPEHWQSVWEREHAEYRRVKQRSWDSVYLTDWIFAIERSAATIPGEVVLVAHSLGCLAAVWWAALGLPTAEKVRGAMLVAPPNLARKCGLLPALSSFNPVPLRPLPFPSVLVGSEDDPYASLEDAAAMALVWGSEFRSAGAAGHINTASGHGDWPDGRRALEELLASVQPGRAVCA